MTVRRTGEHSSSQLSASVITKPIRVLVYGRADRVYYMRCTCRSVGLTRDWSSCRAVPRQRVQSVITSVRPSVRHSASRLMTTERVRYMTNARTCLAPSMPPSPTAAPQSRAVSITASPLELSQQLDARPSDHARIVHRKPLERHCCP